MLCDFEVWFWFLGGENKNAKETKVQILAKIFSSTLQYIGA